MGVLHFKFEPAPSTVMRENNFYFYDSSHSTSGSEFTEARTDDEPK